MRKSSRRPVLLVAAAPRAASPVAASLGFSVTPAGSLDLQLPDGRTVTVSSLGVSVGTLGDSPVTAPPAQDHVMSYDDLLIGRVLGQGRQASVRKAKALSSGVVYALKCIAVPTAQHHHHAPLPETTRLLQAELARLGQPEHPNVVSYHTAFFVGGTLKIVMEY
eukprot:RCo015951